MSGNGDRVRLVELLEVAEEAVAYVTTRAYAEAMAGECTTEIAAARVAHAEGISGGVRAALFAIDGAAPLDALSHLINEHHLRKAGPGEEAKS